MVQTEGPSVACILQFIYPVSVVQDWKCPLHICIKKQEKVQFLNSFCLLDRILADKIIGYYIEVYFNILHGEGAGQRI